jgi:hypothetical protein
MKRLLCILALIVAMIYVDQTMAGYSLINSIVVGAGKVVVNPSRLEPSSWSANCGDMTISLRYALGAISG